MDKEQEIFVPGSVPISEAARIYGKDPCWVRAGIISGWLPIGYATRDGKLLTNVHEISSRKGRINYYISPKKLYEDTGYLWKGKHHGNGNQTGNIKQKPVSD